MRWMRAPPGTGGDSDAEIGIRRCGSEAEMRPGRRQPPPLPLASPRSEKVKKLRRPAKSTPRYSCALGARELMAVLAVVGPVGTLLSLWVLPVAPRHDDGGGGLWHSSESHPAGSRVIHECFSYLPETDAVFPS